jgi:TPR repeat protein
LPSKTCQLKTFNQDSAEVRALCHQAAAQGDAEAQIYLGWMYFLGHGVKQDFPQALKWFGSASEQGEKINMQPQDIFQFMGGLMQFDEEDDAD